MLAGNWHIHASPSVKVEVTGKRRLRDLVGEDEVGGDLAACMHVMMG